jgi:hypothetical protein
MKGKHWRSRGRANGNGEAGMDGNGTGQADDNSDGLPEVHEEVGGTKKAAKTKKITVKKDPHSRVH